MAKTFRIYEIAMTTFFFYKKSSVVFSNVQARLKSLNIEGSFPSFLPWKAVKMTTGHTILLRISQMC